MLKNVYNKTVKNTNNSASCSRNVYVDVFPLTRIDLDELPEISFPAHMDFHSMWLCTATFHLKECVCLVIYSLLLCSLVDAHLI